jgi:UDP-N-acetylglucosamine 2-epimerase (non-hydrolysing)
MCAERRRLAVLTTGRQDFGILRSVLNELAGDDRFELRLWAGGMHLQARFGNTIEHIQESGLAVARRLDFLGDSNEADDAGDFAAAVKEVAESIDEDAPDALLLVGDRPETLAAAAAATLKLLPIAHLHGGEESQGAVDNVCRHAITKMSHLHMVSHPLHAKRVIQMGEPEDSVLVVGAPGLDNLYRDDLPDLAAIARRIGHKLDGPLVLVTLHPTTLGGDPIREVSELSSAMEDIPATFVITSPNSDPGGEQIRRHWESWVGSRENAVLVDALGEDAYWSLMKEAKVVLGNSSSGIIEAPVAGAAVINVGDRQKGRLRHGTVVDVPFNRAAIHAALRDFVNSPRPGRAGSGYPTGPAAPRIVEALARWRMQRPPRKIFGDLEWLAKS